MHLDDQISTDNNDVKMHMKMTPTATQTPTFFVNSLMSCAFDTNG